MTHSAARVKLVAMTLTLATAASVFFSPERSHATGSANGSGESVYKARCVTCHGDDGGGRTTLGKEMKAPDLRSGEVQKLTDAELSEVVSRGKGEMPAFRKKLSRDQIQQVILHVRELAKGH
jgi:cytochrome c6